MKHLILISLMLVVLTMGIVSASDDVSSDVNLTTSDYTISDEGIVFDGENIESGDDEEYGDDAVSVEDESITSNDERENAIKINIHGYDNDMKCWENIKLNNDSYFAEISAPDDATGNVTVFVNGVQCFEKDISDCPILQDNLYCIGPYDLDYDFDMGKYHVVVLYYGDENYLPNYTSNAIRIVDENYVSQGQDAVDIYIWGYDYDIEDYWDIYLGIDGEIVNIDAPDDAIGNVTVFVNGTQCFRDDISNLDKDEYGHYSISLYDIDYDFFPGNYNVKIVYAGDYVYSPFSEENVIRILDSIENVEINIYDCGKEGMYWFYAELDGDFAFITAPINTTGNVTVFVEGVQCFKKDISNMKKDSYGNYPILLKDLDYDFSQGTYFVEIIYDGDENHSPTSESDLVRVEEEGYDDYGPESVRIVIYGYEDTKLDGKDVFAVIHAHNDATGKVTVFINGTQCFKEDISRRLLGSYDYKDMYYIGPQDVDYEFSSGKYLVKIVYEGDDYYLPVSESNIITVIGNNSNHGGASPSGGTTTTVAKNPIQVSVKKDTVKLTLKKVKVKRSAKKLVLQATLKINNKAKKGLKVIFKFNGKKFTAKTNKKGVAKVTIKKKLLKKLKIGKKVKIQVSYGKTTKNMIVKIKK